MANALLVLLPPTLRLHPSSLIVVLCLVGPLVAADARAQASPTPKPTAVLQSISLSPATHQRVVGQIQTYVATGFYSDGSQKNLTQILTYSSTDLNVALALNTAGNKSQVQAVGVGTTTISGFESNTGISTTDS